MTRADSLPATRIRFAFGFAAVVVFVAGCISNQVTVDASEGEALARAATLHVTLARAGETGNTSEDDAASPAPTLGPPVSPAIEAALQTGAESALRAKGYALGSAAESDLILELAPRTESVARRTWSSDPDASGARIVRKSEAVLSLRARTRGETAEVWTCEARARLPESELVLGTSTEQVWSQVLASALERVPDRR